LPPPTGYGETMITALFDVTDGAADDVTRAAERLAGSLASLIPAVIEGLVSDAIIRDLSRNDAIHDVADAAGATVFFGSPAEAIAAARGHGCCSWSPAPGLSRAGPARSAVSSKAVSAIPSI
jgi:hypothetical protein